MGVLPKASILYQNLDGNSFPDTLMRNRSLDKNMYSITLLSVNGYSYSVNTKIVSTLSLTICRASEFPSTFSFFFYIIVSNKNAKYTYNRIPSERIPFCVVCT